MVHSFDVLMTFRTINPGRRARSVAFLLKFALFVCINTASALGFPRVDLDELVLSDFVAVFLCFEVMWSSQFLLNLLSVMKGVKAQLSRVELIFRFLHYTLFTIFRILISNSILEKFGGSGWRCAAVYVLFLEFNGIVIKLMKGDRNPRVLLSTFAESLVISLLVAFNKQMYPLLAVLLIKRHLVSQIVRT